MARLMSVAYTEQAVVDRLKTVTRRKGWWENKDGKRLLHAGDRLTLCRKVMGRKAGEPLVRLAEVEVVDVRRELLGRLLEEDHEGLLAAYGREEVRREGFPGMSPEDFVERFFIEAQRIYPDREVTRIEYQYLDQVKFDGLWWVATCDHGRDVWYLQRATEHLARRSLDAHLRHEHGIERTP